MISKVVAHRGVRVRHQLSDFGEITGVERRGEIDRALAVGDDVACASDDRSRPAYLASNMPRSTSRSALTPKKRAAIALLSRRVFVLAADKPALDVGVDDHDFQIGRHRAKVIIEAPAVDQQRVARLALRRNPSDHDTAVATGERQSCAARLADLGQFGARS